MRFFATCKLGLESTVAFQLKTLGLRDVTAEDARVFFTGDFSDMCRALLWLRTAERLLLEVASFPAETFEALYEGTKAVRWTDYLARDARIHVNGKSAKSRLFSVSDCQSIVKKAIVDNLARAYHTTALPETGREVIVEVGLLRDTATLALDCCGAGLSRRGYRTYNVSAPLSETLGAAIVLLSRYEAGTPLIDPMCGSGTMPIEAAMIAGNRAPGLLRSFAAESWPFLDKRIFEEGRGFARDAAVNAPVDILGSDIDPRCIDLCKIHAKKAGIMARWDVRPLSELRVEANHGILVCNPPYGERLLSKGEVPDLYRQMRRVFDGIPGWSKNIFSGVEQFERIYGRRADKRRKLVNGGMQCNLYQYYGARNL